MLSPSFTLRRGVALAAVALALSGCTLPGGTRTPGVSATSVDAPSVTASPSAAETPSSGASPAESTSAPSTPPTTLSPAPTAPLPTPTAASPTIGATATPPIGVLPPAITVGVGQVRHLTREDAVQANLWAQGPAQPVGSASWIYALGYTVGCQATSTPLEFRFAQTQGALALSVAQSAASRSSTEKLDWIVLVDGRPVVTRSLGFNETADLTVPLASAATVQIVLTNPSPCQGMATGLITRAVVTG